MFDGMWEEKYEFFKQILLCKREFIVKSVTSERDTAWSEVLCG